MNWKFWQVEVVRPCARCARQDDLDRTVRADIVRQFFPPENDDDGETYYEISPVTHELATLLECGDALDFDILAIRPQDFVRELIRLWKIEREACESIEKRFRQAEHETAEWQIVAARRARKMKEFAKEAREAAERIMGPMPEIPNITKHKGEESHEKD